MVLSNQGKKYKERRKPEVIIKVTSFGAFKMAENILFDYGHEWKNTDRLSKKPSKGCMYIFVRRNNLTWGSSLRYNKEALDIFADYKKINRRLTEIE